MNGIDDEDDDDDEILRGYCIRLENNEQYHLY